MSPILLLANLICQAPSHEAIRASDYSSCGLDSFYLICRLRHMQVDWDEAKRLLGPPDADGMHSFADIVRASSAIGLSSVPLQTDLAGLSRLSLPAIVQVIDRRQP